MFSNESLQRILGFRKTISALGKYSMEMFLIHPLVYSQIGKRIFSFIAVKSEIGINTIWMMTWIISLVLIIALAIPTKRLIEIIDKGMVRLCIFLKEKMILTV